MLTAPLLFWGFRLLCKSHSARTWHLLQPENLVGRVFVGTHDQNQCSLNCCCAVESWGSYTVLFLFDRSLCMLSSVQTQDMHKVWEFRPLLLHPVLLVLRVEPRTLYKLRKHSINWATSQVQKLFNTAGAVEVTLKIEGSEVGNFVPIGILPWR